jgi:nuclear pore complex protein Nup62
MSFGFGDDKTGGFYFGDLKGGSDTGKRKEEGEKRDLETDKKESGLSFADESKKKETGLSFGFGDGPSKKKETGLSFDDESNKKDETNKKESGFSFGDESSKKKDSGLSFGDESNKKKDSGLSFGDETSKKKDTSFSFGDETSKKKESLETKKSQPKVDLQYKSIEEIIQTWSSELEDDVKEFSKYANQISIWDQQILLNQEKVVQVKKKVNYMEKEQKEIDESLKIIEVQQEELFQMLSEIEDKVEKLYSENSNKDQYVNEERKSTYEMALNINHQLDGMTEKLKNMVKQLNETYEDSIKESKDDSMTKIVQILNSHLYALHWIDERTSLLQNSIQIATKKFD